jgi:hypothetical protein
VTESVAFVPEDFPVPQGLKTDRFRLEPLGPEHNAADYEAWTSSMDHIRQTPGFVDYSWPQPMTLDENLGDLMMHAAHFTLGVGFTYTVLDAADDDVIGCVYIYPAKDDPAAAQVRSWVRRSHADLDEPLAQVVAAWLASDAWPFPSVTYLGR